MSTASVTAPEALHAAAAPSIAPSSRNGDWRARFARRLALTDLAVVASVVFGTQLVWFGVDSGSAAFTGDAARLAIDYSLVSLALVLLWMLTLRVFDTRSDRVIGLGSAEYKRVADASIRLFGVVAIVAYLTTLDLARGYVLLAFPLGMGALVAARWGWRQWLRSQRARGAYASTVLLVGSQASAAHIARELLRQPEAGYKVVGACVPTDRVAGHLPGTEIPVSGNLRSVAQAMEATGADTVVITSSEELTPQGVRELSWSLEPGRQHLVVAPSLTDIGGPRIHTRPVSGLPLIHVETPRYEGAKLFAKRAFDVLASGALILLLAPVLAAIAMAIRLSSEGPVLFRQERVGLNGRTFTMLKFRSMVTDAEARLKTLQHAERDEGNVVMFKMKNDPRVTPIGRVLRRFSLDELPQLFNVFGGSMSLIGPRPPLPREVDLYEHHVHRRFLVKPGITGLWQVSGRSNLSWEDTVRLDLYYVENWSITGDLIILWKTARAVLARDGAY